MHRTLARSFGDEADQLSSEERDKLAMLETYMQSLSSAAEGGEGGAAAGDAAPLPTRAEDVDKFMAELAAAAGGGKAAEPAAELAAAAEEP